MLVPQTERLKFLVAFRPGSISPMLAAQQAATYQRHSGGQLLLNVVTGGESSEQRAYGDFLEKDDRYVRTGEFLAVVKALWRGETVTLHGEQVHLEEAVLARVPQPVPPIYFGGSSDAAVEVAAAHIDVYLTWGPRCTCATSARWPRRWACRRTSGRACCCRSPTRRGPSSGRAAAGPRRGGARQPLVTGWGMTGR